MDNIESRKMRSDLCITWETGGDSCAFWYIYFAIIDISRFYIYYFNMCSD